MKPFPLLHDTKEEPCQAFAWSDSIGECAASSPDVLDTMRAGGHEIESFEIDGGKLGPPEGELLHLLVELLDNGGSVASFVRGYGRWTEEYSGGLRDILGHVVEQAFAAGYAAGKREKL